MSADLPDRLEWYRRRYADVAPGWEPATAQFQHWAARRLKDTARVLDLGCGRGGIVERLGARGHWTGTDPDLVSVRAHRQPGFGRCCARSERLPFPDEHFDLVVSSWVLEHLPKPGLTFQEVSRVLKVGGTFIFLTPNGSHPLPWLSRKLASLNRMQQRWVSALYHRDAGDTFPVAYLANTHGALGHLAAAAGMRLVQLAFVPDPSYFAWDDLTFWLAVGFSTLLPATWKVHLVGELTKPKSDGGNDE